MTEQEILTARLNESERMKSLLREQVGILTSDRDALNIKVAELTMENLRKTERIRNLENDLNASRIKIENLQARLEREQQSVDAVRIELKQVHADFDRWRAAAAVPPKELRDLQHARNVAFALKDAIKDILDLEA